MQITLTEHDLEQAVRLYVANSGVIRSVASLDFARKIRGEDAGITVNLILTEDDVTAEGLKSLAMAVSRARGINNTPRTISEETPAVVPETPPKEVEPKEEASAALVADEDIPLVEPVNEVVEPEAVFPPESPFATDEDAVVAIDQEPVSPFGEQVSAEAPVEEAVVTPAEPAVDYGPEAVDNPFGSMETLPVEEPLPTDAKSNEQLAANLFG